MKKYIFDRKIYRERSDGVIDTHCHLDKKLYEDIESVIKKMDMNKMIAAGVDYDSSKEVVKLANVYTNIYGVIGFHPEEVDKYTENFLPFLEENLKQPKIVGIGEIGLDYHYTKETKDKQITIFKQQLDLARKYHKTVVIHSRDALEDTLEVIKEYLDVKMVFHCFGYSLEVAKILLKYNVMFGIGGVVTFKNGKKLKEVVKEIPLDRLLLETDSPYLTPEPYRGEKNEPYNILYVAEEIAKIKGLSIKEVLDVTTENAIRQFDLLI